MDGFAYDWRGKQRDSKGISLNLILSYFDIFNIYFWVVKKMLSMSNLKKISLDLAQAYNWEMIFLQYFTGLLPEKFLQHLVSQNNFLTQSPHVD